MDREGSEFPFLQVKFLWKVWRNSRQDERNHEGPNVWWSTEQNWIVHLALTKLSSYKLPGNPQSVEYEKEIEEILGV